MAAIGNNVLFNVGAMALNTSVTYLIGDERGLAFIGENFMTSHDLKSNREVSKKYDTPITPVGSTFAIWGPIFIGETIFTIYQVRQPRTCRRNPDA